MFLFDDELEVNCLNDLDTETAATLLADEQSGDKSRGPYKKYPPMTMSDLVTLLPGNLFFQFMRFSPAHFLTLLTVLNLTEAVKFGGGSVVSGIEALAIFLFRLATLGGNGEIGLIFKRPTSMISSLATHLSSSIFWGKLERLASFDHEWLNFPNLSAWGEALVHEKFFPLKTIAGFLDGKCIRCCRPTNNQKSWYCCHHADHVFKFQIITWLNGMLTCWGPFAGSVNDAKCVKSFGISPLVKAALKFGSTQFNLLADKGYAISDGILTNYHGRNLPREKKLYNQIHNHHRTSAEWGINCILQNWMRFSSKKLLRVNQSSCGLEFYIACHLTNLKTILEGGNRVTMRYNTSPPTLEEYMSAFNQ